MEKASVIISVYKNVDALRLILESLREGSVMPGEVVVSEDGECGAMREFVERYDWFCEHQHLTQADEGWRKNKALNRAVVSARYGYLIFIDGDCVLHPRFVEMHMRFAAPDRVLLGKRVKLDKGLTEAVSAGRVDMNGMRRRIWLRLISKRGCRYVDEGIFIPFCLGRGLRSVRSLIGSNMSMYRKALLDINGFDERYVRPAVGEDTDIQWRLIRAGYHCYSVRNRAIQYHLHHRENWVEQHENYEIMLAAQAADEYVCRCGIRSVE